MNAERGTRNAKWRHWILAATFLVCSMIAPGSAFSGQRPAASREPAVGSSQLSFVIYLPLAAGR